MRNEKKQAFIDGILVALHSGVVLSIAPFLYDDTTVPSDIINNLCPTVSFLLYPKMSLATSKMDKPEPKRNNE